MAMATKSVVQDLSSDPPPNLRPDPPPISVTPETPPAATPRLPQPTPSSDTTDTVHVPSYSGWFSWDHIHQPEIRFLPEFFDSRSLSKNPNLYKYYRNGIVKLYRANPSRKLTLTEARKTLVGDVGAIRRVFDFLEAWGLINYSQSPLSNKVLKWEDKDSKAAAAAAASHGGAQAAASPVGPNKDPSSAPNKKRVCNGCKSLCSIACFVSEKYDMTLCARCYVRGNYQIGVSSSDFRRVEVNEEMGNEWADKDTLHLLEALMHYGEDWRKVAQHVGRSEKECVTHFLKLPYGDKSADDFDSGDFDAEIGLEGKGTTPSLSKRMRLSPLTDASNPIMAQAAFLSALAGVEVAEAAACAAVATLCEADYETSRMSLGSRDLNAGQHETDAALNGDTETNRDALGGVFVDANSQLEKEGLDMERAVSGITEVQMKEIQEKIVGFEVLDLQMDKEWQQVEQMKSMLFVDQLTLLSCKSSTTKIAEGM